MTHWVVDASPLIFLAKLERLALLHQSSSEVYVPPQVLTEIRAQRDPSVGAIEQAVQNWLRVKAPRREGSEAATGEAAVIALALELDADRVVLDDLAARRWARREGLRVVGTVGLLLAARLRGEISDLQAEIERLRAHGFRASDELVRGVLEEAGEWGSEA
jgi:hypothetical protein